MVATETRKMPVNEFTSLIKILFALQQKEFGGMVKITAQIKETNRELHGFLCFKRNHITIAEYNSLHPQEFVTTLARRLKIGYMDSVMQYVGNRVNLSHATVAELLDTIVSTKAMNWEDIERVMSERVVVVLERFLPYPCSVQVLDEQKTGVSYSRERLGFDCGEILQRVGQRQKRWKEYLPALRSLDAVPILREGVIKTIEHQPTRQHLQQWVDGKRSFAEIAEALDQDPLALAPLYFRWTNERLIDFDFGGSAPENKRLPVILSVDDSPVVQAMIRRNLCENYEVISANSAMDALGLLNRREVDLILLDVTMPEIDGLEFCRTIRKMARFKDTPVIMLTAKDGLLDRAKGHIAGTNRYLTKPIDKEQLLGAVREFIQ